jgi:hypothetical protein
MPFGVIKRPRSPGCYYYDLVTSLLGALMLPAAAVVFGWLAVREVRRGQWLTCAFLAFFTVEAVRILCVHFLNPRRFVVSDMTLTAKWLGGTIHRYDRSDIRLQPVGKWHELFDGRRTVESNEGRVLFRFSNYLEGYAEFVQLLEHPGRTPEEPSMLNDVAP